MSRSCHKRHVLEAGDEVATKHPGHTDESFARDRVPLVRHRGRTLLAGGKWLLGLTELAALKVTQLGGDRLDRGTDRGTCIEELGVTVASQHLCGWDRTEPEALRRHGLRPRDRCWSTCRPHPRACRRRWLRVHDEAVCGLGRSAGRNSGQLRSEGRRLGLHAVRPSENRGRRVLDRAPAECLDQPTGGVDQQIGGAHERDGLCRVDDVGRGKAIVDPRTSGRSDVALNDVNERPRRRDR